MEVILYIRLGVKMYLTIKETIKPVQIAATTVPSLSPSICPAIMKDNIAAVVTRLMSNATFR